MDAPQIEGRKSSLGGSGEGREGKEDENPARCTLAEGETDDLPCLTRRKGVTRAGRPVTARYASSGGSREDGDDDEDGNRPPCCVDAWMAGETVDMIPDSAERPPDGGVVERLEGGGVNEEVPRA